MANNTIKFTKMEGAGNDYIYVYLPDNPIPTPAAAATKWSRYHFGIGSDGLILIDRSERADFSMRIFNNDGSEAMMCGNGIRCVGKYVYDHHLTDKKEITIDTKSGVKVLKLHLKDGVVDAATVDMGEPGLKNKAQLNTEDGGMLRGTLETAAGNFQGTYVCMGNPHFVVFVDDVTAIDLPKVGPVLEHDPIFPERCNIEFAQVRADGSIRMRVWERGSGITMACGTGSCATLVAAVLNKKVERECDIEMDGGTVHNEWNENGHIFMTGPATRVFEGEIEL